jgi:hypothetical protein
MMGAAAVRQAQDRKIFLTGWLCGSVVLISQSVKPLAEQGKASRTKRKTASASS